MKIIYSISLAVFFFEFSALAQGTFQNLNFEAANIPPGTQPGTAVPASSALPGWSTSLSPLYYDGVSLGGALVSINDSNNVPPLQGRFSILLFAGPDIGAAGSASISQTALVPVNAQSILMDVAFSPSALFTTTLGGQQIAMVPLQTFANYTVYGGNISAYAGLIETLSITQFPPAPPTVPPSALELDNIVFSMSPIPEPATCGMILCGAAVLGANRWRKRYASSKVKI